MLDYTVRLVSPPGDVPLGDPVILGRGQSATLHMLDTPEGREVLVIWGPLLFWNFAYNDEVVTIYGIEFREV